MKHGGLEAARGLAALAVVLGHCAVAFAQSAPITVPPQILSLPFDGAAAVIFFFVLSGYVLTRRYVDLDDTSLLLVSAGKRYLRLVGPVMVATLLSATLFALGAYRYSEVGRAVGSDWLSDFGYAYDRRGNWSPSFADALLRGGVLVLFVPGNQNYDSPLGTICYEMLGSYLVFGLAFVCVKAQKTRGALSGLAWGAGLGLGAAWHPYYAAVVVGLGLSLLLSKERRPFRIDHAIALVALGAVLLSYQAARNEYGWLAVLGLASASASYVQILGAAAIICGLEGCPQLALAFSGRKSRFLGALSFPIYLVHFLVLGSLGCALWLYAAPRWGLFVGGLIATLATVITSLLVSVPFIYFDSAWVRLVNLIASKFMRRPTLKQSRVPVDHTRRAASRQGKAAI